MDVLAKALFWFAILYVVYAASTFPLPSSSRAEVANFKAHLPSNPLFAPIRFMIWLITLPMESVFSAFVLAGTALCLSGLFLAFT